MNTWITVTIFYGHFADFKANHLLFVQTYTFFNVSYTTVNVHDLSFTVKDGFTCI